MPKTYDKIPTTALLPKSEFSQPVKLPEVIHLTDPALSIMINLDHIAATAISPHDHITDTLLIEKASSEHILFVVDEHHHIIGILTAEDIHGEKPYQIMEEKRIKRSEISVKMVMTRYNYVPCLELEQVKHAKVSNIVATLIDNKCHYALVVIPDSSGSRHCVKGFFWASLISHALGSDITSKDSGAQSFSELQRDFGF